MTPDQEVIPDAQRSGVPQFQGATPPPAANTTGPDFPAAPVFTDRAALDAALLAAHAAHDGPALVLLYSAAGDMAESTGDIDAACFYLTHAYVYALEAGAPEADTLHSRLLAHGREE